MKTLFILLIFFLSISLLFAEPTETLLTPLQIPAVLVDDPGNKSDRSSGGQGLGSVEKNFFIGKYEITASQYCSFLKAVASQADPHHLYKKEMGTDPQVACITQKQFSDGTFSYDLIDQREMLPITYVSLRDAQRFCNWLENNCPANDADPLVLANSTESGAYKMTQQGNEEYAELNPQAHFYIPTETEWVKAAYYKGNGLNSGYWMYPTQHDSAPNSGHGDVTNQANYETLANHWKPSEKNPVIIPVDHFSKTSSFYGACDMGGNVAEWTSNLDENAHLENSVIRGGSWKSQYSIWWDSELMRTAIPLSYDPSTANNFIGFRIACIVQNDPSQENSLQDDCCDQHTTNTESYILWTATRGLFVGCPRMMMNSVAKFFGYDACSLLGVSSIASNSIKVLGAVFLVDLIGYMTVMTALTAASYLIPRLWSLIKDTFSHPHDQKKISPDDTPLPHLTFSDVVQSSMKALLGCGMCQMNLLFTTLKTLLNAAGISSGLLTSTEDFILDAQMAEIPYVPSWIVYNGVPVLIELGLFLVFLEICHEIHYYWPAWQDTLLQFWYAL